MATPGRCPDVQAPHTILFVDDDDAIRKITPLLLTMRGYEVWCAADGIEALQMIKQAVPELVISDLRMPRMSGFEFLSIVRRKFPSMPVIAISGEFLNTTEMMGIADAFFSKGSYSPADLCSTIADLLANRRERRDLESPPIWVPVSPGGDVVLTCIDCLRSFPVRACPPPASNPVRETECVVCGAHLRYCIDSTGLKVGDAAWDACGLLNIKRQLS